MHTQTSHDDATLATDGPALDPAGHVASDCAGLNFYAIDRGIRDLLTLYLAPNVRQSLEPHFQRLGELAGGRLDELSRVADQHPPILNAAGSLRSR